MNRSVYYLEYLVFSFLTEKYHRNCRINQKLVLITASEDVTLPNQIYARWRSFNHDEREIIKNILNDKRVIHWFAENVDETHVKMTSLPLGYIFKQKESELIEVPALSSRLKDRALKALCSHRCKDRQTMGRKASCNSCV
jgi:hypothetical protein